MREPASTTAWARCWRSSSTWRSSVAGSRWVLATETSSPWAAAAVMTAAAMEEK